MVLQIDSLIYKSKILCGYTSIMKIRTKKILFSDHFFPCIKNIIHKKNPVNNNFCSGIFYILQTELLQIHFLHADKFFSCEINFFLSIKRISFNAFKTFFLKYLLFGIINI